MLKLEGTNKDFALQLYGKLWDNIGARESRIWTFLGIYGAALGVLYSSGALAAVGLPGAFLMQLLSLWAARIITTADWWSVRNRLMIGRIEEGFPEVKDAVIPTRYGELGFSSESMNHLSVSIVAAASLTLHTSVGFIICTREGKPNLLELTGFLALGSMMVFAAHHIVTSRESDIGSYWGLVQDYNKIEAKDDSVLVCRRQGDMRKYNWARTAIGYSVLTIILTTLPVLLYSGLTRNGRVYLTVSLSCGIAGLGCFMWAHTTSPAVKRYCRLIAFLQRRAFLILVPLGLLSLVPATRDDWTSHEKWIPCPSMHQDPGKKAARLRIDHGLVSLDCQ